MLDQGQRFSARAMFSALTAQIDKEFFRGEAWNDGVPGLLRATILIAYKFYVWTAFWQLSGSQRTAEDDQVVRRLGKMLSIVRRLLGMGVSGFHYLSKPISRKRER